MVEDDLIGPCGGASVACAGGVYLVPGSPCSRRRSPNCVQDLWIHRLFPFLFLLSYFFLVFNFYHIDIVIYFASACVSRNSVEPPDFRIVSAAAGVSGVHL